MATRKTIESLCLPGDKFLLVIPENDQASRKVVELTGHQAQILEEHILNDPTLRYVRGTIDGFEQHRRTALENMKPFLKAVEIITGKKPDAIIPPPPANPEVLLINTILSAPKRQIGIPDPIKGYRRFP